MKRGADALMDRFAFGWNRARTMKDQRHTHRAVVDEEAVLDLPVLALPLSVIRSHDHERSVAQPEPLDRSDELPDLRVRVRDPGEVGVVAISRSERRRRVLWRVCVENVQPEEEPAIPVLLD